MSLLDRVRALLGDDAVEIAGGADAVPRVAPASPDAVALLLGTAREEGWRVRLEGAGTWLPADAPADLALTTRRLDRVPAVEPQDLSATAEAGIGCDLLRQQLADRGTWLALDPPGLAGRTLGSVVATATAGPLRQGFGAVRDHVLGVTFVTGDGRLVQSGGRVVKNVAGYDLTKLEAGGFGAFGVIVLVHLRLRALPRADQTFVLAGTREDLTQVAEDVAAAGLQPAALELMSPALARRDGWALAVRLAGSAALVAAEEAGLRGASGGRFTALRAEEAHGFWMRAAESFATRPITFRTGGLPDSSDELLDLLQHQVGDEWVSASPGVGAIRWAGDTTVDRSGVGFGRGMEAARALLATRRRPSALARAALWALTSPGTSRTVYALARMLRATGIPRRLAGWGRLRFAMGMLAATKPTRNAKRGTRNRRAGPSSAFRVPNSALLFRGCVMDCLFAHVHDATIRTLQVNGYSLREVPEQVCCGALHAHAGLRAEARLLARANVAAFGEGDEPIVVNSAGCGAMLKEYGHLVDAAGFTARLRDVTELLAAGRGPRPGAPVDVQVAYDPPCHLLHAQRIADEPLRVLAAIPVLRVMSLPDAAQCCGSAGLFTLLEPAMSRAVLAPKLASLRTAAPQVVATGNPGCLMQLGAGLAAGGLSAAVCHPVELLDESYRAAGYYA